jgi:hypothetical protein
MAQVTNAQMIELITELRDEARSQRDVIISGIAELNQKVAVQNGRVLRLEEDVRGTDGIGRKFNGHVSVTDERIKGIEKTMWQYAGGIAVLVAGIEVASHIFKFK